MKCCLVVCLDFTLSQDKDPIWNVAFKELNLFLILIDNSVRNAGKWRSLCQLYRWRTWAQQRLKAKLQSWDWYFVLVASIIARSLIYHIIIELPCLNPVALLEPLTVQVPVKSFPFMVVTPHATALTRISSEWQARALWSKENRHLNHFVSSQAVAQCLEFKKHFWNGSEFSKYKESKPYFMRLENGLKGKSIQNQARQVKITWFFEERNPGNCSIRL